MTDNERSERIFKRLNEDYRWVQSKGYKVLGVFLQGSQNYELDYEGSDIDTKCIVLPSFEDFVLNKKPASTTLIKEDNSHVDVKDIRLMFECFRKQNINFLEILFTNWCKVNPDYLSLWLPIWKNAENIAHYNNYAAVNCIAGMVYNSYGELFIEKDGEQTYNSKQLSHMVRCEEFLNRYILDVPYQACLVPRCPANIVGIKTCSPYSLEEVKEISKSICDGARYTVEEYQKTHPLHIKEDVETLMNDVMTEIIKKSFLEDINAEV